MDSLGGNCSESSFIESMFSAAPGISLVIPSIIIDAGSSPPDKTKSPNEISHLLSY